MERLSIESMTTEQLLILGAIAAGLVFAYRQGLLQPIIARLRGAAAGAGPAVRRSASSLVVPSATTVMLESENSMLEKQLVGINEERHKAAIARNTFLRQEVARAQDAVKASSVPAAGG